MGELTAGQPAPQMEGTVLSAWGLSPGPLLAGRRGHGGDLSILTRVEGWPGGLACLQPLLGHLGWRNLDLVTGLIQGLRLIGWMPIKVGLPFLGLRVLLLRVGHRLA